MSDFGTIITATKKDDENFSSREAKKLSKALKKIIKVGEYSSAMGEDFDSEFNQEENSNSILVILSEYYYGSDNEDEELFEFVKDTELEEANEIAEKLKEDFKDYDFETNTENW